MKDIQLVTEKGPSIDNGFKERKDEVPQRDQKIIKGKGRDFDVPEMSFPEFILSCAEKHRERTCLVEWRTQQAYSYRQMVDDSHKIASFLLDKGMKKGDVFCIYIDNCYDYLVTILGVTLAEGTVTTANPLLTSEELFKQITDSGAVYVLANTINRSVAEGIARKLPHVREIFVSGHNEDSFLSQARKIRGNLVKLSGADPKTAVMAIMYTSGTTGLPKGAARTQYSFIWTLCMYRSSRIFSLQHDDVMLSVLPMYYLMGLEMALMSVVVGAKLILLDRFNKHHFGEIIHTQKVTYLPIVPPIIHALFEDSPIPHQVFSSLRVIFTGGARLSKEHVDKVFRNCKFAKLVQGYGAVEVGVVTMGEINEEKYGIGFPIPEVQLKVADIDTGTPLGPYKNGELWIKTALLMKYYINCPTETANAITNDGWYRTGDIVYYDENGCFHVVDRKKEVIKYKGHQVSPAELEALLMAHPMISEAAVIGIPDPVAGELPKAFVVLKSNINEIRETDIKDYVAGHTAPHKHLRGGVEFVNQLPKSSVGKVMKNKLIK